MATDQSEQSDLESELNSYATSLSDIDRRLEELVVSRQAVGDQEQETRRTQKQLTQQLNEIELSLREVVRVLKPGGRFVFAGEPTKVGNLYARALADLTWKTTVRAMKLPGLSSWRRPQEELDENSRAAALEG